MIIAEEKKRNSDKVTNMDFDGRIENIHCGDREEYFTMLFLQQKNIVIFRIIKEKLNGGIFLYESR